MSGMCTGKPFVVFNENNPHIEYIGSRLDIDIRIAITRAYDNRRILRFSCFSPSSHLPTTPASATLQLTSAVEDN
eukprot:scaffold55383_cov51-Attheya_sp.AAC.4